MSADHRSLTSFDRLRRTALVLAEGVAVVLAAIAVALILLPAFGGAEATAAVTGDRGRVPAPPRFLRLVHHAYDRSAPNPRGSGNWIYEEEWTGLRLGSAWYVGFGAARGTQTTAATVPVWILLGAGLAIGAVRLWWTHDAANRLPEPSPQRRLAVRIGRAWLWSAAALGAVLVVAPHPDESGWSAGIWVESAAISPLEASRWPRLFAGPDAIGERVLVPWPLVIAVPALATLACVGQFLGSSPPVAGEESGDASPPED
ncbi:hypothetical protein [Alienimonas sp. DA493]|uniref:hypothetical protein n=1 Tax=Alienimonas sp. DA493 TaxID=3373605 RepID=UPI003754685F